MVPIPPANFRNTDRSNSSSKLLSDRRKNEWDTKRFSLQKWTLMSQDHLSQQDASARLSVEPGSDAFTKSQLVYGLKWGTFDDFVSQKDVALVMFYDTRDRKSFMMRPHFIQAAENASRENHAFAAVNCRREPALCRKENVKTTPSFRLYSKGYTVDTVNEIGNFDAHTMVSYVENSPVHQSLTRFKHEFPKYGK